MHPSSTHDIIGCSREDELASQNRSAQDFIDKLIMKHEEHSIGLPVGVQVVTPPYKDEVCLRAMKIVSMLYNFDGLEYD